MVAQKKPLEGVERGIRGVRGLLDGRGLERLDNNFSYHFTVPHLHLRYKFTISSA